MIEKKYIAIVGLAAAVLTALACIRYSPAACPQNDTSSVSEPSVTEQTSFTFADLTDNQALLAALVNI